MKALWAAVVLVPGMAWATPPPVGSADAQELQRFTDDERAWIAKQHDQNGRFCCSEGDFSFVSVREVDGHLEIKAKHPDMERGIPSGWIDVEESRRVDLTGQRSVPEVVAAWFYKGRVQCVITGSAY